MARTKGKYTPNRCFQVHFHNKSVVACYLSLSSCAQGQFSKRTCRIVHPDAFKDSSAVTHKTLYWCIHINREYGSVTLAWHSLTFWQSWQLHGCIWNIAISPLNQQSKWDAACDYFSHVCEFYDWVLTGNAGPFLRKAFWGRQVYLFISCRPWLRCTGMSSTN